MSGWALAREEGRGGEDGDYGQWHFYLDDGCTSTTLLADMALPLSN